MSRREQYEQQTEELLEPIVTGHGFELVDVEYVKESGEPGICELILISQVESQWMIVRL